MAKRKVKWETLERWIKEGRGTGHGVDYSPWLRHERGNLASDGNNIDLTLIGSGRQACFLSREEADVAVWLLWLGVQDLREQFPIWPWPHPHPLACHSGCGELRWSRGTLAVAEELGIEHGTYVGTLVPYVATTDILATVATRDGLKAVAIAVKSESTIASIAGGNTPADTRDGPRVRERLILERVALMEIGVEWRLRSATFLPRDLRETLRTAYRSSLLPHDLQCSGIDVEYGAELSRQLTRRRSIQEAKEETSVTLHLDDELGRCLFEHAIWHRRVPLDIRHPIIMNRHPVLTDFSWVDTAAVEWLGGAEWARL
ncbi:hypothetical protein CS8_002210 [Cupriavidus sp. 8B]